MGHELGKVEVPALTAGITHFIVFSGRLSYTLQVLNPLVLLTIYLIHQYHIIRVYSLWKAFFSSPFLLCEKKKKKNRSL